MKLTINKIVFLFFLTAFLACENDMAEIKRVINEEEVAIERAKDVEMLYSDSAVVKVRIKASEMINILDKKEPRREFQKGLNVDVFNERQQIISRLSAKYAIQYEKQDKVILRDSVRVKTENKEELKTEELIWNEKEERVYCEKETFVTMSTPKETIQGYGFDSNLEFTKWKILNVTGVVDGKDIMGNVPR